MSHVPHWLFPPAFLGLLGLTFGVQHFPKFVDLVGRQTGEQLLGCQVFLGFQPLFRCQVFEMLLGVVAAEVLDRVRHVDPLPPIALEQLVDERTRFHGTLPIMFGPITPLFRRSAEQMQQGVVFRARQLAGNHDAKKLLLVVRQSARVAPIRTAQDIEVLFIGMVRHLKHKLMEEVGTFRVLDGEIVQHAVRELREGRNTSEGLAGSVW